MGDAPAKPQPGALGEHVTVASSEPPPSIGSTYAPGDRIDDRYQLLRLLDQGGMGVVWVAHHLALDVHVALKLVRPEAGSEQAADRLLVEAQSAARLNHPAILRVLDVGKTAAGDPYLVMELLDGESLAHVLERDGRIDPVTTIRAILPIADALAALHEKGIVHRDVKPDNIFLARTDSGRWQPKLIDFGVAKLEQRTAKRITTRGMAVGTPSYMSPEQLKGEEADADVDVWALTVVVYEMLTGSLPFEAQTNVDLLMAMLDHAPRPIGEHGVQDDALWEILERGLAPFEERWPSVRALGRALARWLWARGVRHDVSGVALRPAWLDARDVDELSGAAATPSAAFGTPARARARLRVGLTKELAARSSQSAPPTSATADDLGASPAGSGRRSRRWVTGVATAALGVGAIGAAWLGRAPPPASPAGEPSAASPVSTAASAPATSSPVVEPASARSAAPAPSATPAPTAPPRQAVPRAHPSPQVPALPPGLKDPFR